MARIKELVEIASFLSDKPTLATAQVQVDADTLIDLAGAILPVRTPDALQEPSQEAAKDQES